MTSPSSHHGNNLHHHSRCAKVIPSAIISELMILDISLDARLLYVSQSIEDILGYHPNDVVGKSCWEYFHPDEIPFAQAIHGRSIQLDKAANLNYCRIKNKKGQWVACECVFTVVYDVLIGCTSVYRYGPKSQSMFHTSSQGEVHELTSL